jgi:hypothetical protein
MIAYVENIDSAKELLALISEFSIVSGYNIDM